MIVETTFGAGIVSMRDAEAKLGGELTEKNAEQLFAAFLEGAAYGMEAAIKNLQTTVDAAFKTPLAAKSINKKPRFS